MRPSSSPRDNTRDDAYNGDLEARLRFARELLTAVRDAAGDGVAIGVRLAADEITPDGFGPEACAEIAAALCAGSEIDFVSAALGYSGTYRGIDEHRPPPPEPREAIAGPVAHMRRRSPASRSSAPRGSPTSTRPSAWWAAAPSTSSG